MAPSSLLQVSQERKLVIIYQAIALVLFLSLCFAFYKYTVDDAYISLRYARNFANGFGLVFSTDGSPPVEGYTNFLWTVLEAPLFLFGFPDEIILHIVKVAGIALGIGSLSLIYKITLLIIDNIKPAGIAMIGMAAVPYFAFWSIGGLETPLFIFCLLLGMFFYFRELDQNKSHLLSFICFLFLALTRPEGLLFSLTLIGWHIVFWTVRKDRQRLIHIIPGVTIFCIGYIVYFLWRFNLYEYLLPNTFYARSGEINLIQLMSRLGEIFPFILYLLPLFILVIISFRKNSKKDYFRLTLLMSLLILLAFSFASKREWMPGFRYELPFVPFLLILATIAVNQLRFKNWVFGLLLIYLLLPSVWLFKNTNYTDGLERGHIALGNWLKQNAPPDCSYASWDMGAVPYYSELPKIIEIHPEGILSNYITHVGYDVDHFLSEKPCFIVLPPKPTDKNFSQYGMLGFYSNKQFQDNYMLIDNYEAMDGYYLTVYKRGDMELND